MMIFELKEKKDKFLEEAYEKAKGELDDFFEVVFNEDKPKLILLNSRNEINDYLDEKTADWLVAWADSKNVFMLNGSKYNKESSHKYSKEDFFKTLKHELCHIYFDRLSKTRCFDKFIWLSEGVAYLAANQIEESKKPKRFTKFINQFSDWDGKAYQESGFAIMLLFQNFGKQKLLKLIKSLSTVKTKTDFNKLFKKIYGKEPTYSFFNNLLKKQK